MGIGENLVMQAQIGKNRTTSRTAKQNLICNRQHFSIKPFSTAKDSQKKKAKFQLPTQPSVFHPKKNIDNQSTSPNSWQTSRLIRQRQRWSLPSTLTTPNIPYPPNLHPLVKLPSASRQFLPSRLLRIRQLHYLQSSSLIMCETKQTIINLNYLMRKQSRAIWPDPKPKVSHNLHRNNIHSLTLPTKPKRSAILNPTC